MPCHRRGAALALLAWLAGACGARAARRSVTGHREPQLASAYYAAVARDSRHLELQEKAVNASDRCEVTLTPFVNASSLSFLAKAAVKWIWYMEQKSLTLSLTFTHEDRGRNWHQVVQTYAANYIARAKRGGKTVGFVQVVKDSEETEIGHVLNLAKANWETQRGIGARLLQHAEDYMASELGMMAAKLEIKSREMNRLKPYYLKRGYTCKDCWAFGKSIVSFHKCIGGRTLKDLPLQICEEEEAAPRGNYPNAKVWNAADGRRVAWFANSKPLRSPYQCTVVEPPQPHMTFPVCEDAAGVQHPIE